MKILLIGLLTLLVSCSSVHKVGVRSISGMLYRASFEMETEDNWETFRTAVPANLKLMESLLSLDPNNTTLMASLIKGYTSYAFAVYETLYLDDQLADRDSIYKEKIIHYYSRALKIGEKFLAQYGIEYADFMSRMKENENVMTYLDDEMDDDPETLDGVLFFAQALVSLINYQKSNYLLIAQAPVGKALYDWVCSKKPNIAYGACDLFYGAYATSRPKLLGGDPQKGKEHFLSVIQRFPSNWLTRVSYMQFYLIPMMDEQGFEKEALILDEAVTKHKKNIRWSPNKKKDLSFKDKQMRFYQTIAIKRYNIIKKYRKDIF